MGRVRESPSVSTPSTFACAYLQFAVALQWLYKYFYEQRLLFTARRRDRDRESMQRSTGEMIVKPAVYTYTISTGYSYLAVQ